MTLKLSTVVRNANADLLTASLTVGGICSIYTGAQPATGDTAPSGTLLAAVVMNGGWNAAVAGVATTLAPSAGTNAVASGVPGWARISTPTGTLPFDCTVGTSGADLIINASPIVSGTSVQVMSMSIGFPTL